MEVIFMLSRENLQLAAAEVKALLPGSKTRLMDNILIANIKKSGNMILRRLEKRLAYTKKISLLLFCCAQDNLEEQMKSFDWPAICKGSFCVRVRGKGIVLPEKKLAGFIWGALENPRVDLDNPDSMLELYCFENKIFCTLLLHESEKDFESRKAHLRPCLHPTSMHPKLARALVNLTGIENGVLIDPFCGSGGILIEAGLMGIECKGYDIDENVLDKARKNLEYFQVKDCELLLKSATDISEPMHYIATDLPYGRNTKASGLDNLYKSFIKVLDMNLKCRAVVVFPDFYDYKNLLLDTGLQVKGEYLHYLHKSLSKRIAILEK